MSPYADIYYNIDYKMSSKSKFYQKSAKIYKKIAFFDIIFKKPIEKNFLYGIIFVINHGGNYNE